MLQPEMHGEVDPAVLAALPPSMQLGLLLQVSIHIPYFWFQREAQRTDQGFLTRKISRRMMLRERRLCQILLR